MVLIDSSNLIKTNDLINDKIWEKMIKEYKHYPCRLHKYIKNNRKKNKKNSSQMVKVIF